MGCLYVLKEVYVELFGYGVLRGIHMLRGPRCPLLQRFDCVFSVQIMPLLVCMHHTQQCCICCICCICWFACIIHSKALSDIWSIGLPARPRSLVHVTGVLISAFSIYLLKQQQLEYSGKNILVPASHPQHHTRMVLRLWSIVSVIGLLSSYEARVYRGTQND